MAARKTETSISQAPVVAVMVVVVVMMLASHATVTEQWLLQRDDDALPVPRIYLQQIAAPRVHLLHHARWCHPVRSQCLCMVLDGSSASFGISINHTRALELPGVCKVQVPPISQCTAVPTPPAAPDTPSLADEPVETNEDEASPPRAGSAGSNTTSSATISKKSANLMATLLIPTCALFYVF